MERERGGRKREKVKGWKESVKREGRRREGEKEGGGRREGEKDGRRQVGGGRWEEAE